MNAVDGSSVSISSSCFVERVATAAAAVSEEAVEGEVGVSRWYEIPRRITGKQL